MYRPDGKESEVSWSNKKKTCCGIHLKKRRTRGFVLKRYNSKTTPRNRNRTPYSSLCIIWVSGSLEIPNGFEKALLTSCFKPKPALLLLSFFKSVWDLGTSGDSGYARQGARSHFILCVGCFFNI